MFHNIVKGLKNEVRWKDVIMWFIISYICVFVVYLYIIKRTLDCFLLIEILGIAIVFVLMMIGTKAYSTFVEDYYQSFIDRHKKR